MAGLRTIVERGNLRTDWKHVLQKGGVYIGATMQIRGQPSPAEILDIVLEGELLGIGEPLGGGEVDEEESREEKQHLGRKLSVEIVPLVHRKCISGIWDALRDPLLLCASYELNKFRSKFHFIRIEQIEEIESGK